MCTWQYGQTTSYQQKHGFNGICHWVHGCSKRIIQCLNAETDGEVCGRGLLATKVDDT